MIITQENVSTIEQTIDYEFRNKTLLQQAFTRRSYTEENGGHNNEILEFIGDKVLDFAVIKILVDTLGVINTKGEYQTVGEESEGDLTKIKANLVDGKTLSSRMKQLNLAQYLLMGKGDVSNHVNEQSAVQEDLFEAILGAVALDSEWNMRILSDVVERMLAIGDAIPESLKNFEENPVDLVQRWMQKNLRKTPKYEFQYDEENKEFTAFLFIGHPKFYNQIPYGSGATKSMAREQAAYHALTVFQEYDVKYEAFSAAVQDVTEEVAINRLQELSQKGFISAPEYKFTAHGEEHDCEWSCVCHIIGKDHVRERGIATNKKEAKKIAALRALKHLVLQEKAF